MDNRAIHRIHAGQQSLIFQFFFFSKENHDDNIQLRVTRIENYF